MLEHDYADWVTMHNQSGTWIMINNAPLSFINNNLGHDTPYTPIHLNALHIPYTG